jgi:3-oxoacyl-[acyl-carrier protein] reductase
MRLSKLSRSVHGKTVLVTGAASGMGRATAHLFADEGAQVAVTDRDGDGAVRVAAEIGAAGGSAGAWTLDVSSPAEIARCVAAVAAHFGGIDIVVNNAGAVLSRPIDDAGYEDAWRASLAIMLDGQMRLIRAALPWLRRANGARIVNIASTEGLGATACNSPYTVAKHGVIGLTRALAVELGPEGITVNCICPGPIETAMTAPLPAADKQKFARRRTALRRYGDPEEVAHATLSLALPSSSFITGAVLVVDGGLTIRNP